MRAVQGVSLEVAEGELLAIMGPSGSGKSALLNLIGGLDRPTQGDVVIDGHSTRGFAEADWTQLRRERIRVVLHFFNLLPGPTARGDVALPPPLRREAGPDKRGAACPAAGGLAD